MHQHEYIRYCHLTQISKTHMIYFYPQEVEDRDVLRRLPCVVGVPGPFAVAEECKIESN